MNASFRPNWLRWYFALRLAGRTAAMHLVLLLPSRAVYCSPAAKGGWQVTSRHISSKVFGRLQGLFRLLPRDQAGLLQVAQLLPDGVIALAKATRQLAGIEALPWAAEEMGEQFCPDPQGKQRLQQFVALRCSGELLPRRP